MKNFILFLTALTICATPAYAETLDELKARMDKVAENFNGVLGYSIHFRGENPEKIDFRGDEIFPTASTIKTAIMCEAMNQVEQGKIKWSDQLVVQPEMTDRQRGGYAFHFNNDTTLPISKWVHIMITVSCNTATMNLREFLGQKNINDWLISKGFKNTLLLNGKKCDELGLRELQQKWGLGMTTPNEMVRLFELILDNEAGSKASCERMLRILSQQYWDDLIISQVPPDIHSGAKSGALNRHRSDVAFVNSPEGHSISLRFSQKSRKTCAGLKIMKAM